MENHNLNLGADENSILQYLNNFPDQFISVMELSRRAGGRGRYTEESRWAHVAVVQLMDLGFVETDGRGRYRIKLQKSSKTAGAKQKFIAPGMREILEQSGRKIDLSSYE